MSLMCIYGTRPEAIKMAPVIHALKNNGIDTSVCITAQHREMLDQVNTFFGIVPDYDLNIMQPGQSLNALTSRLFGAIDNVLEKTNPDWILVHGDTTTSAVAAWAAFHRRIKVAHVEAGLRTYNKQAPFPEELNRQITGRIADIHFAPTRTAKMNLITEGIKDENIHVTGNTVIDALHMGLNKIAGGATTTDLENIRQLLRTDKKVIAITGHRRENFGEGFEHLCRAIKEIAQRYTDVQWIYPVHLNPNVQEPVNRILGNIPDVHLIAPIDYPAFIYLMQNSYLILTDSGGVQEEAPSLGKPVLVMRDTTERPEAVEAGTVKLTGTHAETIVREVVQLLDNHAHYERMSKAINPYGDGLAAQRIADFFLQQNKHNQL
ncbi:MAG: non-hydrolyzing UDP-N-acetylglucosamine 2-epimerase [Bacteroidota bacterium]